MGIIIQPTAIEYLNQLLHLPVSGKEQDWDIELSDITRLDEFLDILDHQLLIDDQKYALMALIIASYDNFDQVNSSDDPYKERIRQHLQKNLSLYEDLLNYWAVPEEDNPEYYFNISPFIRTIR